MLKIMYALISYEDFAQCRGLKQLCDKSFNDCKILKIHFIAEVTDGIIFSALLSDENQNIEQLKISLLNPKIKYTIKKKYPVNPDPRSVKSLNRFLRKVNNMTMTNRNWKQFIESKKCILAEYKSCEIAHSTISHKRI